MNVRAVFGAFIPESGPSLAPVAGPPTLFTSTSPVQHGYSALLFWALFYGVCSFVAAGTSVSKDLSFFRYYQMANKGAFFLSLPLSSYFSVIKFN